MIIDTDRLLANNQKSKQIEKRSSLTMSLDPNEKMTIFLTGMTTAERTRRKEKAIKFPMKVSSFSQLETMAGRNREDGPMQSVV